MDIFSCWLLKISNLGVFNPWTAYEVCEQVGVYPDLSFISFFLPQLCFLLVLLG